METKHGATTGWMSPKKISQFAELNLKAIKINTSLLLSDLQRTCTEKKINKTKTVRGACGLYPPAVYDRFIFPVTQTWPRGRRLWHERVKDRSQIYPIVQNVLSFQRIQSHSTATTQSGRASAGGFRVAVEDVSGAVWTTCLFPLVCFFHLEKLSVEV